jgi:phage-related protein
LRIRGIHEVRILYAFHKSIIVLLHGFIKKSSKIPKKELQIAKRKVNQLLT